MWLWLAYECSVHECLSPLWRVAVQDVAGGHCGGWGRGGHRGWGTAVEGEQGGEVVC